MLNRLRSIIFPILAVLAVMLACAESAPEPERAESPFAFTPLREWKPSGQPNGLGMDILLEADPDSLTETNVRQFVRAVARDHDPVIFNVYLSREGYQQEEEQGYETTAYKRDVLLNYVRNSRGQDDYARTGVITWRQEIGPFSHLDGEQVPL